MNQYLEIILMFVKAFLVGGAICLIAQVIINFTKLTAGKILVYFMLAGVVLQALGLYQYLVDFAGAGATVPISGFGYLLANGAIRGAQKVCFTRSRVRSRRRARASLQRSSSRLSLRSSSNRTAKRTDYRSAGKPALFSTKNKPVRSFLFGDPENLKEFVRACRECEY